MATRCASCGSVLLENARFCNTCGAPAPLDSVHRQAASFSKSNSDRPSAGRPSSQEAPPTKSRPALREQIAYQPPARPGRHTTSNTAKSTPANDEQSQAYSAQKDELKPHVVQRDASKPAISGRELHVKPREQQAIAPTLPEGISHEDAVEDLPTKQLAAQSTAEPLLPGNVPPTSSLQAQSIHSSRQNEIEYLNTASLAASLPAFPHASIPSRQRQFPIGNSRQEQPVAQRPSVPVASPLVRKQRPALLLIILTLLCFLIIGGLATWMVVDQPFSIPAVTQPQQGFKDSSLGLSLLYPNGWSTQLDRAKATAHFYDSSHTAEFLITVKDGASSNVAQYLQQQATQQGMTGTKVGTSLSFAGTSWQVVQGSIQRSGANYTETIVATVHNNHLFTLTQLAPQSIYADEEKLVFSEIRSSLQFT